MVEISNGNSEIVPYFTLLLMMTFPSVFRLVIIICLNGDNRILLTIQFAHK